MERLLGRLHEALVGGSFCQAGGRCFGGVVVVVWAGGGG